MTLEIIRKIAVEEDDKLMILVIDELLTRPKVAITDSCEACGQPSKNSKIHRACKKWWV